MAAINCLCSNAFCRWPCWGRPRHTPRTPGTAHSPPGPPARHSPSPAPGTGTLPRTAAEAAQPGVDPHRRRPVDQLPRCQERRRPHRRPCAWATVSSTNRGLWPARPRTARLAQVQRLILGCSSRKKPSPSSSTPSLAASSCSPSATMPVLSTSRSAVSSTSCRSPARSPAPGPGPRRRSPAAWRWLVAHEHDPLIRAAW